MITEYSDGLFYACNTRVNPFVVDCICNLPPQKAIDFGCGCGSNSFFLMKRGWEVLAIERENMAIKIAREKLGAARVLSSDINYLDFDTLPTVSLILCNYVLQHLTIEQYHRFITKVTEHMPSGSYMIFSIFERPYAVTAYELKNDLVKHGCKLLKSKKWSRIDKDHGNEHLHIGFESFWHKI